jgi:antitoxin PrlF
VCALRATVRPHGQVSLPAEIRAALHVAEGDDVEFSVDEGGQVTIDGLKVVPADQAWFWTDEWQRGEREASQAIAAGRLETYASGADFLDSQGS